MKWRRKPQWPWAVWHVGERRNVPITEMMNLASLVQSLRCSLLHIESRLLQAAGLTSDRHLGEFTDSGRYVSYVNHHWTDRAKKVTVFFQWCSSSAGSQWPQPSAPAPASGGPGPWAWGAAESRRAPRPPGQHLVDGSTQEETDDRGQPHQEEIWQQTIESQGKMNRAFLGFNQNTTMTNVHWLTRKAVTMTWTEHIISVLETALQLTKQKCSTSVYIALYWWLVKMYNMLSGADKKLQ